MRATTFGSLVGKLTHIHDCRGTEAVAAAQAAATAEGPRQANYAATRYNSRNVKASQGYGGTQPSERSLELPHTNKQTTLCELLSGKPVYTHVTGARAYLGHLKLAVIRDRVPPATAADLAGFDVATRSLLNHMWAYDAKDRPATMVEVAAHVARTGALRVPTVAAASTPGGAGAGAGAGTAAGAGAR